MSTPYGFVGAYPDVASRETGGVMVLGGNDSNKVALGQDYIVDPALPVVALHPISKEPIVIPKGKIVTIAPDPLVDGPAVVSICNATAIPAGVAQTNYYRQSTFAMKNPVDAPIKDQQIHMPYIQAMNGTLVNGDLLMSDANGNFVKWDGTDYAQVIGRVNVVDLRGGKTPGWLRWVTTSFPGLIGPGFLNATTDRIENDGNGNTATTAGTTISRGGAVVTLGATPADSLQANADNTVYFLTNTRVAKYPVNVYVDGVLQAKIEEGPAMGDGLNYAIDPILGTITFATAQITTVAVTASYNYETTPIMGMDHGIPGLTDGMVSGIGPGIQAWFDQVGSVGKLHIGLRSF